MVRRKSKFMLALRWPSAICLVSARFSAKGVTDIEGPSDGTLRIRFRRAGARGAAAHRAASRECSSALYPRWDQARRSGTLAS